MGIECLVSICRISRHRWIWDIAQSRCTPLIARNSVFPFYFCEHLTSFALHLQKFLPKIRIFQPYFISTERSFWLSPKNRALYSLWVLEQILLFLPWVCAWRSSSSWWDFWPRWLWVAWRTRPSSSCQPTPPSCSSPKTLFERKILIFLLRLLSLLYANLSFIFLIIAAVQLFGEW